MSKLDEDLVIVGITRKELMSFDTVEEQITFLKKAYWRKANEIHPDVNHAKNATELTQELNRARDSLEKHISKGKLIKKRKEAQSESRKNKEAQSEDLDSPFVDITNSHHTERKVSDFEDVINGGQSRNVNRGRVSDTVKSAKKKSTRGFINFIKQIYKNINKGFDR